MLEQVLLVVALLAVLGIAFAAFHRRISQNAFRKLVHLTMGLAWIELIPFISPTCRPCIAWIPCVFLAIYIGALYILPRVTALIGRDGEPRAAGIIEYIVLFTLYPLVGCDVRFGRALMCLLGGDGFAGLAASFKNTRKTFVNPQKSYAGMLLGFIGSMLYLAIYD